MTIVDFAQGFGAVQLATGIPTSTSKKGVFYHDDSLGSKERRYYSFYVGCEQGLVGDAGVVRPSLDGLFLQRELARPCSCSRGGSSLFLLLGGT